MRCHRRRRFTQISKSWVVAAMCCVAVVHFRGTAAFMIGCKSGQFVFKIGPRSSSATSGSWNHAASCSGSAAPLRRLNTSRLREQRRLRMDDEVARDGIKEELTTRDDYLATRFTKLSVSGHDLTPLTPEETREASSHLPPSVRAALFEAGSEKAESRRFRDSREKGLYACAVGGLPLFTSGWKLEPRAQETGPSFAEPCDEEHLRERRDDAEGVTRIFCPRSGIRVGKVVEDTASPTGRRYLVMDESLEFHPLGKPLPVRCQPENYWGSEGQYRAWQFSE